MLNQLLRSGNQRSKSWPSQEEFEKELGFGQCGGPRGGTSKPAPEQAPPSDAGGQVTARIMQSFVLALEYVISTTWILNVLS